MAGNCGAMPYSARDGTVRRWESLAGAISPTLTAHIGVVIVLVEGIVVGFVVDFGIERLAFVVVDDVEKLERLVVVVEKVARKLSQID
ncbi:hypothetical protein Tco_0806633 [Tanacetum coccineum]